MPIWSTIAEHISTTQGDRFTVKSRRSLDGGCINSATLLEGENRRYFVKHNEAARLDMFRAEVEGLQELAAAGVIRVPQPICWGTAEGSAYLVLEYLKLSGGNDRSQELLGRQLAQLHRVTRPRFGWHRDNTIGSTPQINTRNDEWAEFWRRQRLGFQLQLAARNGYGGHLQKLGERLLAALPAFITDYRPLPSLLHGDLWGGNHAVTSKGEPVIFDPAVYYGDRETDLAMTELFGGFSSRFYDAYRDSYPLDPGYRTRKTIYNLYHVLNHLNLFGGGYASQAEHMMDMLLSEVG